MQTTINRLYTKAHTLLHLGDADGFVYAEDIVSLNKEVHGLVDQLWKTQGQDNEEEARLCLSILMAYNGMIYADTSNAEIRRSIYQRACTVLSKLPSSLLKCQLLVFCYAECGEEQFAREVKQIVASWEGRELSREEREVLEVFEVVEK